MNKIKKISIIGPGFIPIPNLSPNGFGAVEQIIEAQWFHLEKLGWEVQVVNTTDLNRAVQEVNDFAPDVCHLQYDNYIKILQYINCPVKIATSHFGFLTKPERRQNYEWIFHDFILADCYIFCLSTEIKQEYIKFGCDESRLFITPNGFRDDLFQYKETPSLPNKSIYLGKIESRKKQADFQQLDSENRSIDFAGPIVDNRFNPNVDNYLGPWSRQHIYDHLTNYANLILLSDGEAHPLVVGEMLAAGGGVVVSEQAAANLDRSLPFICVIPDDKLNDGSYVLQKIYENREISLAMRGEIRKYALENFSWEVRIKEYVKLIESLVDKQ